MDCSTPGFHVPHYHLKFAETHVHWVGDATQPSHPLSSSSTPAFNLTQQQGLFQWADYSGGQSIGASASASVLPKSIQGWFSLGLTGLISLLSKGLSDSQESSPAPQFESINSLALCLLYCLALTSVHDYRKDHSLDYMDLCQQSDVFAFHSCQGLP